MLFCHIISELERFRGKIANYKGMILLSLFEGEYSINWNLAYQFHFNLLAIDFKFYILF